MGRFYKYIFRQILIFGSYTWVATPGIRRSLEGFHHRVVRKITGKHPQQQSNEIEQYPLLEKLMQKSGLEDMETYISRRKSTVAQFIMTRPILDICL